ncbi:MAG: hypothetical protein ABW007_05255, partial [Chitinophagaceae bacterium]
PPVEGFGVCRVLLVIRSPLPAMLPGVWPPTIRECHQSKHECFLRRQIGVNGTLLVLLKNYFWAQH